MHDLIFLKKKQDYKCGFWMVVFCGEKKLNFWFITKTVKKNIYIKNNLVIFLVKGLLVFEL